MQSPDAIIVGAGPAGLACAMTMREAGLAAVVLEKADMVGSAWRRHYDRLHLHTDRRHSGLPGMAMPESYPAYPSRAQMVDYLEAYAAGFDIRPAFNTTVSNIRRDGGQWRAETGQRPRSAPVMVVATGIADAPYRPAWPDSDNYRGSVIHSSDYRNPSLYAGKRVLVVGFGNSGGEIALDLANAGIDVALAVRGPVQVLPRDLLGFPILLWAILYRHLPARFVDTINAPILRLATGSIEKLGLQGAARGPLQMIEENGRVPLIDVGTLARIRDGSIRIRGGIDCFTPDGVVFTAAREERFDAVILATGFRPDLRRLIPEVEGVFDAHGMPRVTGRATAASGLYFCGHRALFLWPYHLRDRTIAGDRHRSATDCAGCEAICCEGAREQKYPDLVILSRHAREGGHPVRFARSTSSQASRNTGPPPARGRQDTISRSRDSIRPSLAKTFALKRKRVQEVPGARCTRSRACSVESTRVSHHRSTGIIRHFLRNGFNGFLRALRGDRAFLSPFAAQKIPRDLTPASGRPDHTTSPSASASLVRAQSARRRCRVHRIPHPTFATIMTRPSLGYGTRNKGN
ncbi:MAG: NAD(P)/FAD-dependent oxidoreductase [Bradyrhizobium sp.]|uniref:flavin-containing monooxygenase n=1 Tax=Bradyrhizobium sp. TaxID=376 RepID=UPI001C285959|nr:NAD(P)/FAD-dependent oxidoreductase [Bradyrhizobium sp.]MBU6461550.1 NAD(P)/FAD-dependent oxidoreductase [Pseudomonadota bacterium]MDE2066355.1 NAD(P)/FAD-dependent oxidoreductase [Bradyrhizobium sp.]MDE2244252.1 NAD(P)/FAD-dependent oxidoreductase [Bradyrhizobium sp.]